MNKDFKEFAQQQEEKRILRSKGIQKEGQAKEIIFAILKCLFQVIKGIIKAIIKIVGTIIKGIIFILSQLIEFLTDRSHIKLKGMSPSKQNKLIRKFWIVTLILIVLIPSTIGILVHRNRSLIDMMANSNTTTEVQNNEVKQETLKNLKSIKPFGDVSIKINIGSVDPGYYGKGTVRYKTSSKTVTVDEVNTYGIAEFTTSEKSGGKYVKNFTDYIKSVDKDFYDTYFGNVNKPGSITFTTGWQDAATEEEDKFRKLQFDYLYINYVEPTMASLEEEYKIDSDNEAIKELVYSTSIQYGLKGTLKLFKDAGIEKGMKVKDIITKVEEQKIAALGDYTYTDSWKYTDDDREEIKTKIESEEKELLNLL